ncbi:MAG: branched-chain amino acid aminotransferase [Eubacteriales bacterium]
MLKISITKNPNPAEKPDENALGFGKIFTDHMVIAEYKQGVGWRNLRIVPFGTIPMHPAAAVFHYGTEIFEGLKAYRTADGKIQMFRPDENAKRMNNSARRMCLPTFDEDDFVEALRAFVELEQDWIPSAPGTSLYLRPFMFANDPYLGVHAPEDVIFMIIASPVGSYFPNGMQPIKIMIENSDVRAVRGGTGEAKCGGNYAASNRAGHRAEKHGYSQVLWLDGIHQKYIEEVGAMNIMFKIGDTITTPALSGSILPGITRKSALALLEHQGIKVCERAITIDEIIEAIKDGSLDECWGIGTAAVIAPIGTLAYDGVEYTIGTGDVGPVAKKLHSDLTGIQWGTGVEDPFGWAFPLEKAEGEATAR